MKAINLLNNNYQYEVHTYKNVLYLIKNNSEAPYYILEESHENKENIKHGYLYSYYMVGNQLYTGFYSNVYECFANDTEQLKLF